VSVKGPKRGESKDEKKKEKYRFLSGHFGCNVFFAEKLFHPVIQEKKPQGEKAWHEIEKCGQVTKEPLEKRDNLLGSSL